MSEILRGVLNMPPELWTDDPIDVAQRHAIYREAWDEIDRLQTSVNTAREAAFNAIRESQRLRSELDAANNRFHAMNSPTGREIELQHALTEVQQARRRAEEIAAGAEHEVERLKMLVLSARDAINEYHRTKTAKALDEVTRIAGMCNKSEMLDVPYVKSVVESVTAQIRRERDLYREAAEKARKA